ncbi:MAG TPA: hypothetical protein VFM56_01170, partial [Solimonas sp.]|nr:hypothetical protein [Solimonas sp.]
AIVHTRAPLDAEALRQHLAARLVGYKIPASFEFVAEAVRGDDGKVRRSALRDERIAAQPRQEA